MEGKGNRIVLSNILVQDFNICVIEKKKNMSNELITN